MKINRIRVTSFLIILLSLGILRAGDLPKDRIPLSPDYEWILHVRVYGTTDVSHRTLKDISVYTSGPSAGYITSARPDYDDNHHVREGFPRHQQTLKKEDLSKIYEIARRVIEEHALDTKKMSFIEDGTSVAITMGANDKKITATFDHDGHENSREYGVLRNLLNSVLPEGFKL